MARLKALLDKYKDDLESIAILSSGAIATFISRETPVDHGDARASWTPSINEVKTVNIYPSKGDQSERHDPTAVANQMRLGDTFHYSNGIDYIIPLEYGHSQLQAPNGMARRGYAKWQKFVDDSVRDTLNGS